MTFESVIEHVVGGPMSSLEEPTVAPLVALTADDIDWGLPAAPEADAPSDAVGLLVDALLDAQAYRTVAFAAIHHAHRLQVELTHLRAQHARLLEEYRSLCASQRGAAA